MTKIVDCVELILMNFPRLHYMIKVVEISLANERVVRKSIKILN